MKQQVLKALANPARIFNVPFSLAILNFAVQFVIFIFVFIGYFIATKWQDTISPLWFLLSVLIVHLILAGISKKEPQLDQIISAKFKLIKNRIPKRLAA